ncbi:MAG: type II/IV secretion system protein, partial [Akkermansiaceae bacterium]|nr:type II/IV secretion system protein [Akkermansiaceae bacterium]
MNELLIDPARATGCADLNSLEEVIHDAALRQRSPVDDILDSGVVDEEPYMRTLAEGLGMEWLDDIPEPGEMVALRTACGPQVALKHRLLPVEIIGEEEGGQRLILATYDPL